MVDAAPSFGPRYRPVARLGEGAQGAVWRCFDLVLEREVAVKLLPRGEPPEEFLRLQALAHPGIVRVLDVGRGPDGPWFSMEVIAGRPWGAPGAPPEPAEVWTRRVGRLLEAVAFLHDRGFVHGDLKPDNVLLAPDDRVVVIDFGLALDPASADRRVRGTPGWIAPEVLGGDGATVASDLYAVGVLAATAATGRLPFAPAAAAPGLAVDDLLPATPSGGRSEARWLASTLRREPGDRPGSAREALAELEAGRGVSLGTPGDAVHRLAPVTPIGQEEIARALHAELDTPGLVLVRGPRGSGRRTALSALLFARRAAGEAAVLLDLDAPTAPCLRALARALPGGASMPTLQPTDPSDPDAAVEAHRRFLADLVERFADLLGRAGPCVVVLGLHRDTSPARALRDALARGGAARTVFGTDDGTIALDARAHDMPPLGTSLLEQWLTRALGGVAAADALVSRLSEGADGRLGPVRRRAERLMEAGALRPGEGGWTWTPEEVADVLATPPPTPGGPPAARAAAALADARDDAERGELAAAQRRLQALVGDPSLREAAPDAHRDALELLARTASVLGSHEQAAAAWARLRVDHPDPARDVPRRIAEAQALQSGGAAEPALAALDACGDALAGDPTTRARAASIRGCALLDLGRFDDARAVVTAALPHAPPALAHRLELTAINADWQQGEVLRAEEACRSLIDRLPPDTSARARASVQTTLATCLRIRGELAEAAAQYEEAGRRFAEGGWLLQSAKLANNLGIVQYLRGDWLAAIEAFDRFQGLTRRLGNAPETANACNNLGCLYRDTGQFGRARASFEEGLKLAEEAGLGRVAVTLLGNLAETAGLEDPDEGEARFAACLAAARAGDVHAEELEALRRLAQLRLDRGDRAGAADALDAARATAAEHPSPLEELLLDGLAKALALADDPDPAAALRAVSALDAADSEFEAARLRLRIAEALGEADRDLVTTLATAAEAVFEPLPARPELQRIRALRRRLEDTARAQLLGAAGDIDALRGLALDVAQEVDLDTVLTKTLDRALDLAEEDRGFVLLLDEHGVPRVRAARPAGAADEVDAPSRSAMQRVLASGEPLAALDIVDDASLRKADSVVVGGIRSIMCVPIRRGARTLGLIYVDAVTAVGGSADRKLGLLSACADAASVAIENAQLFEALERRNEALAILAHELRTPVGAIQAYAGVLADEGDELEGSERAELAGTVRKLATRAATMISDVLDLARLEAGKVRWKREPVDPLLLVVNAVETVRPLADQAGVRLTMDAADRLIDVMGDADRLIQVLVNLLSNAIKFSPNDGTVGLRAETDEGTAEVIFVVQDEGAGIPEASIARVFDAYQQAGESDQGVGLGLAICRRIVREHGGSIRAMNRAAGGTRLEVRIPAAGRALSVLEELPEDVAAALSRSRGEV